MVYGITKSRLCCFFGHKKIDFDPFLKKKLYVFIEKLIFNKNFTIFLFGGFGEFDELCWEVVTELKEKYPYIKRVYCLENETYLRENKRPKYLKKTDYEEFVYLNLKNNYWYNRIFFRNRAIIDECDCVVFYIRNLDEYSGAYKAYCYAKKINKPMYLF